MTANIPERRGQFHDIKARGLSIEIWLKVGEAAHTILHLANTGLEIIQGQVANLILKFREVHGEGRLRSIGNGYRGEREAH